MPIFAACMEIEEVQGIESIRPTPDRAFGIKFECSSCREVGQTFVYVDPSEEAETDGGGVRHAAFKCAFCSSLITANILESGKFVCAVGEDDEDGNHVNNAEHEGGRLFTLDVRRGEPVELEMDEQWIAQAKGGSEFEEVDLSQDWCDYDEVSGESVALMGVKVFFEKIK